MRRGWTAWFAGAGFLILFVLGGWRQAVAHPEPSFRRLNQAHGLSNNGVLALLQDRQGFIWIATEDGLNRYDGVEFKIFRVQEDGRTPTFTVRSLCESRDGALWVGTNAHGLARFDRQTETFTFITAGLPVDQGRHPRIEAIFEDGEGTLWLGFRGGLGRLTPDRSRVLCSALGSEAPSNWNATALVQDAQGWLWIGGAMGLWRLKSPSTSPALRYDFPEVLGYGVRALCLMDNLLYIGGWHGLHIVDTADERLVDNVPGQPALARLHINAMQPSPDRQWLWLGTDDGLLRYHRRSGEVVKIQSDPRYATSLAGNDVRSLLVDRAGALWVGDGGYGLSLYAPSTQKFRLLHHDPFEPNSLSGNFIRGLAEAPDGMFWVATQYNGLNQVDLRTGRITRFTSPADADGRLPLGWGWVWAVCADHQGVTWVGTQNGVYRSDAGRRRFIPFPSLPRKGARAIIEDRNRNLWFGFGQDGLYRLAADRKTIRAFRPASFQMPDRAPEGIQCLYEDRAGRIWIGYENAVSRLDPITQEARVYTYRELGGRRADGFLVVHVNEDQSGRLWVVAKGFGVHRYDAKSDTFVESLTTANGLPHDNAYGLLPDDDGRLWISTDQGLACYDPATKRVETFGLGAGLQGLEFNRAAVLRLSSGALLFGGPNGLNWFFPRDIKRNSVGPPVAITEARTPDRTLPILPEGLVLRPDDRALTLKFVALDFSAPEENRYAYRLVGFDRDWRTISGTPQATYTNLPPGEFVFQVKAANPDGVWNEAGTSVLIRVQAPWWRTWWASVLYIGAGGAALVLAFRFQSRRLRVAAALREAELRTTMLARENRQRAESEALLKSKNEALALANEQLEASTRRIEEANAQLREANERLQELDRVKQGFTAMLVHDLKSPLAVVLATLEFLEMQSEGDADALELIEASKTNINKLSALITEVLDVFRSEAQDIQLAPCELDIANLLNQCAAAARIIAREKNIEVQTAISSDLPLIRADGKKLERVFMNLLSNAIKFTPPQGGVTLEASVLEGSGVERGKRYARVSIIDTGPGIPAEELPFIFDPYRQSNSGQKALGVGLGLSIVRRIVAAHGGAVSVRSQVGVGSAFTVMLPVTEVSGSFAPPSVVTTAQAARRTPTGIGSRSPNKNGRSSD